jgi:hypothetical protein
MVNRYSLTNVNADRGFESWPGYEVKPPDCHSSVEAHGLLDTGFPATGRICGRRADVVHPSPGSFGSTVTELIFVRAQCLTILILKHFALCGKITGSSYCSGKCKMLL